MDGIQAIQQKKNLTAICVKADDFYGIQTDGIHGVIKTSGGEIVIICDSGSGKIKNRFPDAESEDGITAINFSGDGFERGGAEDILAHLHSCGINERYVSVSEIGMTLYVDRWNADRAWKSSLMFI